MLLKSITVFADRTGDQFQWRKPVLFEPLCELGQNGAVFAMLCRDNLLTMNCDIRTSQGRWRLESAGVVHPEWTIKGSDDVFIASGKRLGPLGIGNKAEIRDSKCGRFLWQPRNVLGTSYEFISKVGGGTGSLSSFDYSARKSDRCPQSGSRATASCFRFARGNVGYAGHYRLLAAAFVSTCSRRVPQRVRVQVLFPAPIQY